MHYHFCGFFVCIIPLFILARISNASVGQIKNAEGHTDVQYGECSAIFCMKLKLKMKLRLKFMNMIMKLNRPTTYMCMCIIILFTAAWI